MRKLIFAFIRALCDNTSYALPEFGVRMFGIHRVRSSNARMYPSK